MFCPQCHAEYRRGFTRCSDCDVDLVHELPAAPTLAPACDSTATDDTHVLWRGIDQNECVSVCLTLRDKDIPYHVAEFPTTSSRSLHSGRRYVLSVSFDDYDRGKASLDLEEDPPATFSEEQWKEMEDPDDPDQPQNPSPVALDADDAAWAAAHPSFSEEFTLELQQRRDAYTRAFYPEDATSEIWSQDGEEDLSGAIEMILKEHFIHCRIDRENGQGRAFVLPRDKARAKEIVREMIDNAPGSDAAASGFRFCPLCLAEYRPGFNECSECHVALASTYAEASSASTRLWTGDSDRTMDQILAVLDAQNIPAHYRERVVARAQITFYGFKAGKQPFEYSIRVFRSDLDRARAAIADIREPDA